MLLPVLAACVFSFSCVVVRSQKNLRDTWPACVAENKVPKNPLPITADIREFIKHPDHVRHRVLEFKSDSDVGMFLRDKPHNNGEMVDEVLPSSPAFEAGVRKGWIITAINGIAITGKGTLKDLAKNLTAAKAAGPTIKFKFDVRAAVDCMDANCHDSDRFPADTPRHCAIGCERITYCQWWSWSSEGEYKMCYIHGEAAELANATGFSAGRRTCEPMPKDLNAYETTDWPGCALQDADLSHGTPVFADVRPFIEDEHLDSVRHKDFLFTSEEVIGLALRDQPHDLGEMVSDVVPDSQAHKLGVQPGWIIKAVNDMPFTKSENVTDIHSDFEKAKLAFSTISVKFDVKTFADCTKGYCGYSDKFPAKSAEVCAAACAQVKECGAWSRASDEEDATCFLRRDWDSLRSEAGSTAGGRGCRPPSSFITMIFALFGAVILMLVVCRLRVNSKHIETSIKMVKGMLKDGKKNFLD